MNKEQLLIAEYTSIMEHFRSYQTNRLNIILLAVPAVGAVMLNAIDKKFLVQVCCMIMLYFILLFLALVDKVFMKRLRNYTIRLSNIENEFSVSGHATQRLLNPNRTKDATSNTIRQIVQALNLFATLFSITLLYLEFFETNDFTIWGAPFLIYLITSIPLLLFIVFFFTISFIINPEKLPTGQESGNKPEATAAVKKPAAVPAMKEPDIPPPEE